MKREAFLEELREYLSGEVRESVILDSISYYRGYIEEQMRAGKTEEQVLDELGDANFIAISIIDANGGDYEQKIEEEMEPEREVQRHQDPYREMEEQEKAETIQRTTSQIIHWGVLILILIVVVGVAGILFKALLPFIIILIAIGVIKKLFDAR